MNSTPKLPEQVISQIRAGRKIEAIKLLREAQGIGLKEAKDAVDAYQKEYPLPQQPRSGGNGLILFIVALLIAYGIYQFLE